ncbi:MAG TPA: hypothetical protein VKA58_12540, partial [Propionibacteriaceae bacterium]|nr:hypothetical protein [Propionibacteriaceae bacterium]
MHDSEGCAHQSPLKAASVTKSQAIVQAHLFTGPALAWTLAVLGWEACGLGEAVEDVSWDFNAVLVLPR